VCVCVCVCLRARVRMAVSLVSPIPRPPAFLPCPLSLPCGHSPPGLNRSKDRPSVSLCSSIRQTVNVRLTRAPGLSPGQGFRAADEDTISPIPPLH
jgi:hypothetical protein